MHSSKWTFKTVSIKILKIAGWLTFSLVILLVAAILLIRLPSIQTRIVKKVVAVVSKKIGTPVTISSITLTFPKKIVIEDLYVEDQSKDTLLYAHEIGISTDLWSLTDHKILLNDLHVDQLITHITRPENTTDYNFDYIVRKFSDTTGVKVDTTTSSWTFSLSTINLTNIKVLFSDSPEGTLIDFSAGDLGVKMDLFDINASAYHVGTITLSDVNGRYVESKSPTPSAPTSSGKTPDLDLKNLVLKNLQLRYEDQVTGQIAQLKMGAAKIIAEKIDLSKNVIELEKIDITETFASFHQMKVATPAVALATPGSSEPFSWKFKLGDLSLRKMSLQYYDFTQQAVVGSADFAHLWISSINMEANNLTVENNRYEGNVRQFSFAEKNGFGLKTFSGVFNVDDHQAILKNVITATNRSHISFSAQADYSSLASLGKDYSKAKFKLQTQPSYVATADILYLNRGLLSSLPFKAPDGISLNTAVSGKLGDLDISNLEVSTFATTLNATGSIKGLPDVQHSILNFSIQNFYTTGQDLKRILPDSLLPTSIALPNWLNVKGEFTGTLQSPSVQAVLSSDAGDIELKGHVNLDTTALEPYELNTVLHNVAIGKIIKQPDAGSLSMSLNITGSGLTMRTIDSKINLVVSEFQYKGYDYKNFKLDGTVQKYFYTGTASLKDDNIDLKIDGELDQTKKIPSYTLNVNLISADFKSLHLTSLPIKSRGTLNLKLATEDFKAINGTIAVRKVAIFNGEKLYKVDSLLFASIDTKEKTDIKINSDIIDGAFTGTIHLASLPNALARHFNTYFVLSDTLKSNTNELQNFTFSLNLKKTELITDILVPSLKSFHSSPITGSYNSQLKELKIHADVEGINYADFHVRSFNFDVTSDAKSLSYALAVDKFRYDSIKIPGLKFTGNVAHDSIKTTLTVLDSLNKEKYALGAVFNSLKDEFQFRFIPGKVMLNYNDWTVPDDNYIRFHKDGFKANHFSLTRGNEQILFETKGRSDSTVLVGFRRLDLSNLFNIVSGQNSIVTGKLDGDLNIFPKKNNAFNAKLKIIDLQIVQRAWGDLTLSADRVSNDKFDVTLILQGKHDDVKLHGSYVTTAPASTLTLEADIAKLDLNLLEPYTFGQIKNSTGGLTGKLSINGTVAHPSITGDVTFKDVTFLSSYVNTSFTLKNETLKFSGSGLILTNFQILDDSKNAATFKGSVQTKNYRDFTLDLSVSTKNFKVLNTTAANNSLYYGKVKMNATAKVTGPLSEPLVELRMGFSDDTEFTYIVPTASKGVLDQKGIVTFVDKHPPKDPFMALLHLKDTAQNNIRGFDLTATIELKDAQKFNIIIDPRSGDKLTVQGSTTLVVKIDPAGNMDLSGQYEISKGSYSFSFYKLVKRDFEILKGGTITWAGDPMDATMNLTALYKVETSALELLSNPATELGSTYHQSFPFLVYLMLKGDLNAPDISFRLDMPEGSKSALGGNVYAAIQDVNTREPDLNKQVFSLLVLKRFMADDPFENQVTTSLSSNARSSVSGLLSEQLNRLSQNVKGVQLSFDVKSYDDYTTGTPANQTQLQLGVSKTLLHDKLVVKLSGNVDIAGENTNQNSLTDYIGDLALEYKLTTDGRLRLTGFRNSDYDMIDGELTKTGAGLIYIKDYNAFKELFKANAKDQ